MRNLHATYALFRVFAELMLIERAVSLFSNIIAHVHKSVEIMSIVNYRTIDQTFRALGLALFASKNSAACSCPFATARCNAVSP